MGHGSSGAGTECGHAKKKGKKGNTPKRYLCNQWHWWVIFPNSTKLELVEHPLRSSTNLVNLASRSTILVDPDLVDLECLGNFWWSGAENGESGAGESLPNRPIVNDTKVSGEALR